MTPQIFVSTTNVTCFFCSCSPILNPNVCLFVVVVRRGVAKDWLLGLGPPPPPAAAAAALHSPFLFPSERNLQLLESMHWWTTVTYHIVRNYFKGNHSFFLFFFPSGFNANLLMQFMEWEVTDSNLYIVVLAFHMHGIFKCILHTDLINIWKALLFIANSSQLFAYF